VRGPYTGQRVMADDGAGLSLGHATMA